MLKKVSSKTVVRRKLVVRREIISQLEPHQLERVVGGWSIGPAGCPETQQSQAEGCVTNPD